MKTTRLPTCFAVCISLAGCASNDPYAGKFSFNARYERYEPSLVQIARLRAGDTSAFAEYQISDMDVVNFSDHVKSILRSKFTNARFARYTSATAQVILSGAAGASAAFDAGATTVATLALASAATPQLGAIFNAKARAETYQDAVRLIEEAEVDYLTKVGSPSNRVLTDSGLDLYRRTTTTIHVVEKAIVGQLPTLKEMQDVSGQSPERPRPTGRAIARFSSAPPLIPIAPPPTRPTLTAKPTTPAKPIRHTPPPSLAADRPPGVGIKPSVAVPEKLPSATIPDSTPELTKRAAKISPATNSAPGVAQPEKLPDAVIDSNVETIAKPGKPSSNP